MLRSGLRSPRTFGILSALILSAGTLTLSPSAGHTTIAAGAQAFPRGDGDSLSIDAVFAATGGSITRAGAFTAGPAAGSFRIVATSGALADTSTVTVSSPPAEFPPEIAASRVPGESLGIGIPFGPAGGWDGSTPKPNTELFTLVMSGVTAPVIVDRISAARSQGVRLLVSMTGGAHARYKTDGVFDMTKWQASMDRYNTPAIKAAVAGAVASGTLIGNIVMDEPANTSADNTWGPRGTMNKARVDSMAAYAKAIFPTLPMGVALDYRIWNEQPFRVIDFQLSQYRKVKGSVTAYRDGALALGVRDGHAIMFSLNILDGGEAGGGCPYPETGGPGTYGRNCRMTASQVLDYGRVLGPAGCAFTMWRYDPAFMGNPENREAFDAVAGTLAKTPAKSCKRR